MKLLLHVCCGPCATAIITDLQRRDFAVTAFFYNPNIQPKSEAKHRFNSLRQYLKNNRLPLLAEDFALTNGRAPWPNDYDLPFRQAIQKTPRRPARCLACYRLRLAATAQRAAENNCEYFTTTLLSSPHQDINAIKKIGEELAERHQVKFYAPDSAPKKFKGFRPLFTASRKLAKQEHLYEQTYCGCLASRAEM